MEKIDTATQHAATEIVQLNHKIALMLQQWLLSSRLTPNTLASLVPDDVIRLMRQVDALLLVIGHAPKYTRIIAEHCMEHNVVNHN